MLPTDLELAIFKTITYFAHANYPLTSFEIWKWLLEPKKNYTLNEVVLSLDESLWLKDRLFFEYGFYGLKGASDSYETRRSRLADAFYKYQKLERLLRFLKRLPYLSGMAICNSLAFLNTTKESDIDLLLIAKSGRIWSLRFWATLPLILLKERPKERDFSPICLSFFVTQSGFALESLKIGQRDPYLAYWILSLVPVVERVGWVGEFMAKNSWVYDVLPNAYGVKLAPAFRSVSGWGLGPVPGSERLLERLQENYFPAEIKTMRNKDTRVVTNDSMLKFHAEDRRARILQFLDDRIKALYD